MFLSGQRQTRMSFHRIPIHGGRRKCVDSYIIIYDHNYNYRFVYANLQGKCRRRMLLEYFGEEFDENTQSTISCCDVCESTEATSDRYYEIRAIVQALDEVSGVGEKKVYNYIVLYHLHCCNCILHCYFLYVPQRYLSGLVDLLKSVSQAVGNHCRQLMGLEESTGTQLKLGECWFDRHGF